MLQKHHILLLIAHVYKVSARNLFLRQIYDLYFSNMGGKLGSRLPCTVMFHVMRCYMCEHVKKMFLPCEFLLKLKNYILSKPKTIHKKLNL